MFARRLSIAFGNGSNGIGGLAIGTIGTGTYAGYKLTDGTNFNALDIVSPANPNGAFFTTRGYAGGAGGERSPQSGALTPMFDVSPEFTGWQDANRGFPIPWNGLGGVASHSIQSDANGTFLRLLSGPMSTAEQALLNSGVSGQTNRAAMLDTRGRHNFHAPAVVEAYLRMPVGPAGQHPDFWNIPATPVSHTTGNEYGFESNSGSGGTAAMNAYLDVFPGSSHTEVNLGATYRGSTFHKFTIVMDTASWKYYVDDVLVNTINTLSTPIGSGNNTDYSIFTNHVYNASFNGENYDSSQWTTAALPNGIPLDLMWMRVWVPTTGTHFTPLVSIPDMLIVPGQAFSFTLPTATALWGSPITDYIAVWPNELEEPAGSSSLTDLQVPSWMTITGRTLSGTAPNASGIQYGAVTLGKGSTNQGMSVKPARFRFVSAPYFSGATSASFVNGQAGSYDLYAAWDCGRNFVQGVGNSRDAKGLTATGLPTGMTLGTDGRITGTPTVNSSFTVTTTATNASGQTTSQNITMTVQAAATAVAAPAGITSATLVGSWDPADASTVTINAGLVSALAKSSLDTTSAPTLANASTGPTLVPRTDGAGNTRNVLRFTAASSQYLQVFNSLGITAGCTLVIVSEHATNTASQVPLDISNGAGNINANRHCFLSSTSSGFSHNKADATTRSGAATSVVPFPTGIHLHVGRSPVAASTAAIYNLDGQGTAIVSGTTNGVPASLSYTTLGADRVSSAQANFLDGWVYRILVYSAPLTDADAEAVAVWAATNYGTPNVA